MIIIIIIIIIITMLHDCDDDGCRDKTYLPLEEHQLTVEGRSMSVPVPVAYLALGLRACMSKTYQFFSDSLAPKVGRSN